MTRFWNNTKTALLLGGLFGLVLGLGWLLGREQGLFIAFIMGGLMNFVAFFFSDKIALAAMGGQQVDERSAPDLVPMVRRLAQNANLPMPKVYICPQEAPNAFATGRSPSKAAVAVTRGAIELLSYDELEGVIGHELAHVKNRDTLISTVAATIAGAISYLAWMAMWFGGGRDRESHPLTAVIAILAMILAPIAAALIQMAISRSREYVADHDGARIAGTPWGLINALEKLESYSKRIPMRGANPALNHMFIIEPFLGQSVARLFMTHPRTTDRVAKLKELA